MLNRYKLSNGLEVVTERLPHLKTASVGVWVKAGSVDESVPEASGASHFCEHMLFKGTRDRTYQQISIDIEKNGGVINAFTSKESTTYYVRCLDDHLLDSIDVLADIMFNSLFDAGEIEKEKTVILEELKMYTEDHQDYAAELINMAVFNDSLLGQPILGTEKSISSMEQDILRDYVFHRYRSDSTFISVVGNFDEKELEEYLEEKFGMLIIGADPRWTFETGKSGPEYHNVVRDIEQTQLIFGTKGAKAKDADLQAHKLYSYILGGGMASRLFVKVREELGLAYNVGAATGAHIEDGIFEIYAAVANDKTTLAAAAIKDVVSELAQTGALPEELSMAKQMLKSTFTFSNESSVSRMMRYGRGLTVLDEIKSEEQIVSEIDAVTNEDILAVAQKFSDFRDYSVVTVGGIELDPKCLIS
ncbi:MAG: insulinase family protein [Clostridiales Family XIII bacterium]|jgi:predicted Zn-dependent peptidase|nr:insulinase family protein [Clostridiales Family XIII bacterium]